MIQGVVKAESEANELRVQLNAWHTSFGTTQLTHALAERDTLITALRECVVSLELAKKKHNRLFAHNLEELEELPTPFDTAIFNAKSTLERYKHEHP